MTEPLILSKIYYECPCGYNFVMVGTLKDQTPPSTTIKKACKCPQCQRWVDGIGYCYSCQMQPYNGDGIFYKKEN